jgi:type VI secretion system protein ImpG
MSTDKYFEREYNFLQVAGEEFGKKHATLGSMLHLSERQRKDPFVERLFEGFAFLAGRIHERLDDEFPELAGGLLEILFPHLLRPFPSCSILRANHKTGAITQPVKIDRNSEIQTPSGKYRVKYKVLSGPKEKTRVTEKEESAEFIFRTTQDMVVRPMRLVDVKVEDTSEAASALILRIQPDRNTDFKSLNLDTLQIYLDGSKSMKYNLLYYLTNFVSSLSIKENDGNKQFTKLENYKIGIPELTPELNYEEDELAILPYSQQTFSGYRLLQEYFAFPDRFFFIDIVGLDQFEASQEGHAFDIKIEFNKKLPREKYPAKNDILLHCTPIINLFDTSVEEVIATQRLPEYYIVPDLDRRKSREIYSINKVTGIGEDKIEHFKYIPITAHEILDSSDPSNDYKRFYSIFRRYVKSDMAESYIRLFGTSMDQEIFSKETISLEATLSNGFLPPAYLEAGSISQPRDFPAGIEAANITLPSEVMECPEQQNYLWSLISHLSVSYNTLADTKTLKSILTLYNWSRAQNDPSKKKIEAIKEVYPPAIKSLIYNQSLIRGIEFKIEIDPDEFENGEGDIYLFGSILNRFLAQYITLNSYVYLTIVETGTNKTYTWKPQLGKILPV